MTGFPGGPLASRVRQETHFHLSQQHVHAPPACVFHAYIAGVKSQVRLQRDGPLLVQQSPLQASGGAVCRSVSLGLYPGWNLSLLMGALGVLAPEGSCRTLLPKRFTFLRFLKPGGGRT
eukprot:5140866-Pyramimonas_sp.AAC.2